METFFYFFYALVILHVVINLQQILDSIQSFDSINKEFKMKKQEISPIMLEIKMLSKKFKCLSRQNIRIVHQFCQYDIKRTQKVMTVLEDMKDPSTVIQALIKQPQNSEELLWDLEVKYQKLHGGHFQLQTADHQNIQKESGIVKLDYQYFEFVHDDTMMSILHYLDPYSFFKFSVASKRFYKIANSDARSEYYKTLCTNLFKMELPKLPAVCRFEKIKDYILLRPLQYGPNIRNAVVNNLRNFIWKLDINSFHLQANYYKSFGSYQNLYKNCPRLNMNGYYVLRDKYVRVGVRNEKNPIKPIHIIYYYRYFRFLQDGTVLFHVRNKKIKSQQILNVLSKNLIDQKDKIETMVGEYVQYKNKLFVKTVQNREIFSYQFQIRSTDNQTNNELKIIKYTLQLIDDQRQIHQTLYASHPDKEDICFTYCRNDKIALQNGRLIQSNSL